MNAWYESDDGLLEYVIWFKVNISIKIREIVISSPTNEELRTERVICHSRRIVNCARCDVCWICEKEIQLESCMNTEYCSKSIMWRICWISWNYDDNNLQDLTSNFNTKLKCAYEWNSCTKLELNKKK